MRPNYLIGLFPGLKPSQLPNQFLHVTADCIIKHTNTKRVR